MVKNWGGRVSEKLVKTGAADQRKTCKKLVHGGNQSAEPLSSVFYSFLQVFHQFFMLRSRFTLLGTSCHFEKTCKKLPAAVLKELVKNR